MILVNLNFTFLFQKSLLTKEKQFCLFKVVYLYF